MNVFEVVALYAFFSKQQSKPQLTDLLTFYILALASSQKYGKVQNVSTVVPILRVFHVTSCRCVNVLLCEPYLHYQQVAAQEVMKKRCHQCTFSPLLNWSINQKTKIQNGEKKIPRVVIRADDVTSSVSIFTLQKALYF